MNWHRVSWIAVNCMNCPTGMISVAIQFMERSENSWRSQFMMRQHQFIHRKQTEQEYKDFLLVLLLSFWLAPLSTSLTGIEPNKVLRAKKCLSFVNLAYDTASIASFGFLVYSTFLPLKTALHHKRVFFSGFLAWLRADIWAYFKRKRDEKSKKDAFAAYCGSILVRLTKTI